jgi:hypothetical protein
MNLTVELTGAARAVAGVKIIPLELPAGAVYRDIVRILAQRYPTLIGLLIDADGETFLSSNLFVINGDLATPAMVMDEHPREGDHLILMSVITGG